jgi:2-polyprenyl-6-hydroxyphenyl methylase / 3-demethylubiquinone-9 3-methyltransferase
MDRRELHGGSYHWWPPKKDHVILFRANPLRLDYFERFVGNWCGMKVLDVGCGGGYASEHLARRQAIVYGTDILEESLREARDHAMQGNLRIDYSMCSAEQLPYDDEVMDSVTCFEVLEHVADKQRTLSEIYRVLRPGGWLLLDTLNKTVWSKVVTIWLGEVLLRLIPRGTHDWSCFISPEDLQRLMETAGFKETRFAGIRPDWRRRNDGGLPVRITPEGNTAIAYFVATMKPNNQGRRRVGTSRVEL